MFRLAAMAVLAIALGAQSSREENVSVYGPRTFERQQESVSFLTPAGVRGPFRLTVFAAGVTGARIKLNGAEVLGETDFRGGSKALQREITLVDANQMTVETPPGTSLTLVVTGREAK